MNEHHDHADRAGEPGNAAGGRDCDQARGQDKGREGTATQRLDEFPDADLVTLSRRRFKTVQHLVQRSNGPVPVGSLLQNGFRQCPRPRATATCHTSI